jgi:hypothetical protein
MKTISIMQPYATLIAAGVKTVENRSWQTKERGRILIHASTWTIGLFDGRLPLPVFHEYNRLIDPITGEKHGEGKILDVVDDRLILLDERYRREYELLKTEIARQIDDDDTLFPEHAIVGECEIAEIASAQTGAWSDPSMYNWQIANPILYDTPALEIKGSLRFWNCDTILNVNPILYVKE